jgi:hypothetical protein
MVGSAQEVRSGNGTPETVTVTSEHQQVSVQSGKTRSSIVLVVVSLGVTLPAAGVETLIARSAVTVEDERWTLIIIQEFLHSPRRYGELRHLLPGIGATWRLRLATRLAYSPADCRVGSVMSLGSAGRSGHPRSTLHRDARLVLH